MLHGHRAEGRVGGKGWRAAEELAADCERLQLHDSPSENIPKLKRFCVCSEGVTPHLCGRRARRWN